MAVDEPLERAIQRVPMPGRKPVFLKTDRAEIFDEAKRQRRWGYQTVMG